MDEDIAFGLDMKTADNTGSPSLDVNMLHIREYVPLKQFEPNMFFSKNFDWVSTFKTKQQQLLAEVKKAHKVVFKRVEIDSFPGLRRSYVDLHPSLTILAGPNMIGKSQTLKVFEWFTLTLGRWCYIDSHPTDQDEYHLAVEIVFSQSQSPDCKVPQETSLIVEICNFPGMSSNANTNPYGIKIQVVQIHKSWSDLQYSNIADLGDIEYQVVLLNQVLSYFTVSLDFFD